MIWFIPIFVGLFIITYVATDSSFSGLVRASVTGLFGVLVLAILAGGIELQGRPRPIQTELRNLDGLSVISYVLDEPHSIWLWLMRDEPIAYRLRYSPTLAENLVEANEVSTSTGNGIVLKLGEDGKVVFHPEPVFPLPPKS